VAAAGAGGDPAPQPPLGGQWRGARLLPGPGAARADGFLPAVLRADHRDLSRGL